MGVCLDPSDYNWRIYGLAVGPFIRYPVIQISWPVAAFNKPRNGGLGRFGRDLNSG